MQECSRTSLPSGATELDRSVSDTEVRSGRTDVAARLASGVDSQLGDALTELSQLRAPGDEAVHGLLELARQRSVGRGRRPVLGRDVADRDRSAPDVMGGDAGHQMAEVPDVAGVRPRAQHSFDSRRNVEWRTEHRLEEMAGEQIDVLDPIPQRWHVDDERRRSDRRGRTGTCRALELAEVAMGRGDERNVVDRQVSDRPA